MRDYARFRGSLRTGLLTSMRPLAFCRDTADLASLPKTRFHSVSLATNASGSLAIPSAIWRSSKGVLRRILKDLFISSNFSVVRFSQTYDPQSGFTNRKDHNMQSVFDEKIGCNSSFGIMPPNIRQIARTFPIGIMNTLKSHLVHFLVGMRLGVIPFKAQHVPQPRVALVNNLSRGARP